MWESNSHFGSMSVANLNVVYFSHHLPYPQTTHLKLASSTKKICAWNEAHNSKFLRKISIYSPPWQVHIFLLGTFVILNFSRTTNQLLRVLSSFNKYYKGLSKVEIKASLIHVSKHYYDQRWNDLSKASKSRYPYPKKKKRAQKYWTMEIYQWKHGEF